VLGDLAVLIVGGGESIADIDVLRHRREVLGPVASASTGGGPWTRSPQPRCEGSMRPRLGSEPSNAGSNTAADYVDVLIAAIARKSPQRTSAGC
jgi:hypothetical protein